MSFKLPVNLKPALSNEVFLYNYTMYTLIERAHLGDWSPEKDSNHPDDLFQSRYVTPGFKPFSYIMYVDKEN